MVVLTTGVLPDPALCSFGRGVAFDVPNKVFSEQKQMAKDGLTDKRFEKYTAMVEEECLNYIAEKFDDEGEMNFHQAMAEMIVFTATRCLHGIESVVCPDPSLLNLTSILCRLPWPACKLGTF